MTRHLFRCILVLSAAAGMLGAQQANPTGVAPSQTAPPPNPTGVAPSQGAPQPAQTPAAPAVPAPAATPPQANGVHIPGRLSDTDTFSMDNVSLTEMVQRLAQQLKINYILDPRIKGAVTLHTYGEVKQVDLMPMLQTILRVNGAAIVQVGDLYHIVPIASVSNLPTDPITNVDPKTLPEDERMVLDLIFLKYATADEIEKLLTPFFGEGASHSTYLPANLLIVEDNSRSMKRMMELINLFDSDTFAGQRVRLFEVTNSRPTDLAKNLDTVFKAYALSEKTSAVKFIPLDGINTLIAIAPNPGIFVQVKDWIDKLDIPVKVTAGSTEIWTYRMHYSRAEIVAAAVMALYSGNPSALMQMAASANSGMVSAGMGMNGTGAGLGMGMGGGYGGGGYGGGGYGGGGYGGGGYGGGYNSGFGNSAVTATPVGSPTGVAAASTPFGGQGGGLGQTGSYMGMSPYGQLPPGSPIVIPNPFDNTLLVKGSPQDIEQIKTLLTQLDLPPRQVLIDAKIYEVDLDNEFAEGVESYLQKVGSSSATGVSGNTGTGTSITGLAASSALAATGGPGGLALTIGALVSKNNQLLGVLNASETRGKTRVISAPSIIATDSIPATMNVGTQVPVLSSQGVSTGVQSGGSSVFASTVSNQSTGVTLSIVAHVNSSGVVTMIIDQQVSAPVATSSSTIQSPSFSNRSVSTQVTVQDGDTIAIGGAILETHTDGTGGVPILSHIPVLGLLFGSKNVSTQRTELIIFLTPRVIYDTNQINDATEEIKNSLKRVGKLMRDNHQQ
jgi:general secretion pathway protein D